jgi:elongation factor G
MTSQFIRFLHRETVQNSGVADGKVIRQRGGFGVYAHIQIEVRALNRGQGTMVAWNAGLNIPAEFVPAVLQGIQDTMNTGVLAELELRDISVSVQDGSTMTSTRRRMHLGRRRELHSQKRFGKPIP